MKTSNVYTYLAVLLVLFSQFSNSFSKAVSSKIPEDRKMKTLGLLGILSGFNLTPKSKLHAAQFIFGSEFEGEYDDDDPNDDDEIKFKPPQIEDHSIKIPTEQDLGYHKSQQNLHNHATSTEDWNAQEIDHQSHRTLRQVKQNVSENTETPDGIAEDNTESTIQTEPIGSSESPSTLAVTEPNSYTPPASGIIPIGYGPPALMTENPSPWSNKFPPYQTMPQLYELPIASTAVPWTLNSSYGIPNVSSSTDYGPSQIDGVDTVSFVHLPTNTNHYHHESWPWYVASYPHYHPHHLYPEYIPQHHSGFKPSYPDHFRNIWEPYGSDFKPSLYPFSNHLDSW